MLTANFNPTILLEPATHRVVWVSPIGQIPQSYRDHLVVRGEAARWLYVALTGHPMEAHPGTASAMYARCARAHLQRQRGWAMAQQAVAHRAVIQWGQHIRPWLGAIMVDATTRQPVTDPRYHELISLVSGEPIRLVERYRKVLP